MSLLPGIAAVLLGVVPGAWPALRGGLTAETGLEYDSNANRAEGGPEGGVAYGSPLLRGMVSGVLDQRAGRHRLHLQLTAGGKIFFLPAVQTENVGVLRLNYEDGAQLGRVRVAAILDYHDAFQQASSLEQGQRDFRAADTGLRVAGQRPFAGLHRLDYGADLTGQLFMYKPASGYDFLSPSLFVHSDAHLHAGDPELGHDIEVGLHARGDYRGYRFSRTDTFVELGAHGGWIGKVLLQAGYTVQLNFSSVAVESYLRQLVLGKLVARVPGDLYVTVKGQLNFLLSAPSVVVPVADIDQENRSLVMVDLERPLPRGFAISARYTAYFNIPFPGSNDRPYQRHTGYVGFSYRFQSK